MPVHLDPPSDDITGTAPLGGVARAVYFDVKMDAKTAGL